MNRKKFWALLGIEKDWRDNATIAEAIFGIVFFIVVLIVYVGIPIGVIFALVRFIKFAWYL